MPITDPFGFGATDYLEFTFAVMLVAFAFLRPIVVPAAVRFANRPLLCMSALALLPILLRLMLLPNHPVPRPDVYDEFGHLFVAQTMGHWRLSNPMHPMHRFFETFFVLQEPTYSSIYPVGQGLILAIGALIFGLPWAGIVLATGALCALIYWMLRAFVNPEWALLGGLLGVIEFGPLSGWMNTYWGGPLTACAGCLVFGALPRIKNYGRLRDGAALGVGLAIHVLTRPFESVLLLGSVVLFFVGVRRVPLRAGAVAAGLLIAAGGVTLLQNRSVTGNWLTLPYQLSRYQYGVPTTMTFQAEPVPHRELTAQQKLEYESQRAMRPRVETISSYVGRIEYRVRFYRFFFLAPLYVALIAYLTAFRSPYWAWVLCTVVIFGLGSNFYPPFQVHYIAAVTCLFILISVVGLVRLSEWRIGRPIAMLIVFFCVAEFAFWYGLHLVENNTVSVAMRGYESWDSINHYNPARRILVDRDLAGLPGQLLVLVRYSPQHMFQEEWVYNAADIDASRIVWARDRGAVDNAELMRYYPRRTVWLLEPDFEPPKLTAYQLELQPQTEAAPVPVIPSKKPKQPTLRFEDVK